LGDRPGLNNRPGTGDRPIAGNRPDGNRRPNAGDRPNAGNRPGDWQQRQNDLQGRINNINNGNRWNGDFNHVNINQYNGHADWGYGRYAHGDWYHGYWGGHYNGYWNNFWNRYPAAAALGLTTWGLNRMWYGFGYYPYYNPYYVSPYPVGGGVVLDYSQPLTAYQQQTADPTDAAMSDDPAQNAIQQAREDFYNGNYQQSLLDINAALTSRPGDAVLHEFRALILFALGQYHDAAATIHDVLAIGPGWDWTTMSGLYPDITVYTEQLRRLEDDIKAHPDAADERFLVAYHYMTEGYNDAAATQLKKVVELEPRDTVAQQLLSMVTPAPAEGSPAEVPASPGLPGSTTSDIDKASLVGNWKAQGQNSAQFELALQQDGRFDWTYLADGKSTEVSGVYAVQGENLALEPDSGGTMLAQITAPADGSFHFVSVGSPANDPGLTFKK
jgi:tetratricopeptide (TPR) repeat protein